MAKKKNTPSVTATVRGQDLEFKSPTTKQWTRYIEKVRNNKHSVGKRELLQVTCVSHGPSEIAEILSRSPAAISALTEGVEELSGGDVESKIVDDTVVVSSAGRALVVNAPDVDVWESFQDRAQAQGSRLFEELLKFLCGLCEDSDDLKTIFAKAPGAANLVYDDVAELAGNDVSVVVKKG